MEEPAITGVDVVNVSINHNCRIDIRPIVAGVLLLLAAVAPSRAVPNGQGQDIFPWPAIFNSSAIVLGGQGLLATYGINAGTATLSGGITAASGTFTQSGGALYSLQTSSGINVAAGGVTAPFFVGGSVTAMSSFNIIGVSTLTVSSVTAAGAGVTFSTHAFFMNGKVGIGTAAPLSKLGVNGNLSIGAAYATVAAPASGMIVEGNVGIGTSSPATLLDVNGKFNVLSGGNVGVGTTNPAGLFDVNGKFTVVSNATGNVGIGVTTPAGKLHVAGDTIVFGAGEGGVPTATTIRGAAAGVVNTVGSDFTFDASNGTGDKGSGNFIFRTAPAGGSNPAIAFSNSSYASNGGSYGTSLTYSHTVNSGSNAILLVAVMTWGTVATVTYNGISLLPGYVADVNGMRLYYMVNPPVGTYNVAITLGASNFLGSIASVYFNVDLANPIRTNTTATSNFPSINATINSAIGDLVVDFMQVRYDTPTPSAGGGQTVRQAYSSGSGFALGSSEKAGASSVNTSWSCIAYHYFSLISVSLKQYGGLDQNAMTEAMRITNAGKVGIGTISPAAKLDVAGSIKIADGTQGAGKVLISDASGLASWGAADGDDLGEHTATRNIQLNDYWLSNDGGSEGLRIDDSGNIGVGTVTPGMKLDVSGNMRVLGPDGYNAAGEQARLLFGDITSEADANTGIMAEYDFGMKFGVTKSAGGGSFGASSMDALVIRQATGNIGISTGAPQARLDVLAAGSAETDMAQIWRKSNGDIISSMSATGVMMADRFVGNGSGLTGLPGNVDVSTLNATAATAYGGINITTNVFVGGNAAIGGYTKLGGGEALKFYSYQKTVTATDVVNSYIDFTIPSGLGAKIRMMTAGVSDTSQDQNFVPQEYSATNDPTYKCAPYQTTNTNVRVMMGATIAEDDNVSLFMSVAE